MYEILTFFSFTLTFGHGFVFKSQVEDFISIDENFELNGDVTLNSMNVKQMIVKGEIKGSADNKVNGISLKDLEKTHFSRKHDQKITEPMHIDTVVLRNGFDVDFVNGHDFRKAIAILKSLESNEQILNKPNVVVDHMFVNGSIWLGNANGFDFEAVKANAIRLDEQNSIDFPIVFLDPIYINGNMHVNQLNAVHFDTFVDDLVRKSANTTRIYGTTIFTENVTVLNNIEATTINDIQIDHILTKNYKRELVNPIEIHGNVYIPKLIVEGKLNGVDSKHLNAFSYDQPTDTFHLHKDVYFNSQNSINISYLNSYGGYNEIGNVRQYLQDVIRTDRPAVITGKKTFSGPVHFENSIDIVEFNGVNLPEFLSKVIYIDQEQPADIYSDVVFEEAVKIARLEIAGDLITETINNCSVIEWVEKSIRKDMPFSHDTVVFPTGTFEAANIYAEYLNENLIDELLTLNTPQNFSEAVRLSDVYSSVAIRTNGLVSGYNLQVERRNTLMVIIGLSDQYHC